MKRHSQPSYRPRRHALQMLCTTGLLLAGTTAQAQLGPYFVRVSERISYDSNVFRTSSGERRDAISLTSLTVGLDQPIGRQRVYASATGNYSAYKNNDQLNSPGYNLLAGLNWEAASKLSGELRGNVYQSQASLADYGTTQANFTGKNVERAAILDFSAQYGGASVLALQAVANHTDVRYSSDAFAERERKSNMVGGGVSYRPNIDWRLGALLRGTKGEYPRGVIVPGGFLSDDYDRRDIDLTAAYTLSGVTSFAGRLTHTKEEHDQLASRDFSGLTGEITWAYRPTGKLEFNASLGRDTGSGSEGRSVLTASSGTTGSTDTTGTTGTTTGTTGPTGTTGSGIATSQNAGYLNDSRVTDRLRLSALWNATARIQVLGGVGYSRESYDTLFVDPNNVGALSSERGNTRSLSLSARWAVTRVWSFECGAGYEERSLDSGLSTTYDYEAKTGFCSVTLALQ